MQQASFRSCTCNDIALVGSVEIFARTCETLYTTSVFYVLKATRQYIVRGMDAASNEPLLCSMALQRSAGTSSRALIEFPGRVQI
jgi:hypothetical protein